MSNVITNLKVRFGADSSNFKKGMDEGKKAMGDLKKEGSSAFADLASMFGINVNAINRGATAFSNSMKAMGVAQKGAAAGSGILTTALKVLKLALVSTGIGAIVVALGSMAAYFTRTKEGSDKLSQAMDYLSAAFSVIVDRLSAVWEAMTRAFSDPKKLVTDLWEFIKSQFLNRIKAIPEMLSAAWKIVKGIFDKDIDSKEAAKDFQKAWMTAATGLDENQMAKVKAGVKGLGAEIANEAKAAAALRKELQALEDREIALIEVQAKRRKEIAAARLMSRDEQLTTEQRLAAAQRAVDLENKNLQEQLEIARERARIVEQQKALGNNLREDDRELAEAKAKVAELEEQSLTRQRRMVSEINTLTNEINSQTEALKKQREERERALNPQGSLQGAQLSSDYSTSRKKELDEIAAAQERLARSQEYMNSMGIVLPDLQPAVSVWENYSSSVQSVMLDLGEFLQDALNGVVVGFAETFGQLLAGTGTLNDFSTMVMTSLADLAINVGKMAIKTGTAVEAIQIALKSLKPYVAIAAGVALVALGSAIKAGLSKAASGGGGGAISSAGSYGSSGPTTLNSLSGSKSAEVAPIEINIKGEFKQKGDALVSVIDETHYRRKVRT